MTDCTRIRDLLVLYTERALDAGEHSGVRDHLARCSACSAEAEEIEKVRAWLLDPGVFEAEDSLWNELPARLAGEAQAAAATAPRWVPSNWGSRAWIAGLAASLALGCGAVWIVHRQDRARPALAAQGNAAFLRQMQSTYAREATAQYLSECQDLLLNVMRAEPSCEGQKYDVSAEVTRARSLLQRKRRLDVELRSPEIARAKDLCDELENVLIDLSMSARCETPGQMQSVGRLIAREQLMLRINVLRAEL